jgi:hypothetical protein
VVLVVEQVVVLAAGQEVVPAVEREVVLAPDQVRAPEGPEADPEGAVRVEEPALAAVGLALALAVVAAGRGLAEEALAPVADLVAGKLLEGG